MQHSFVVLFAATVFATIAAIQGPWSSFWSQSSTNDAPPNDGSGK